MRPPKLGSIWIASARIQIISGSKWVTVGSCIDTPNAIRDKLLELVSSGYKLSELWVVGTATDRCLASKYNE